MATVKTAIVVLDDWENGLRDRVDWTRICARATLAIHNARLRGANLLAALRDAEVVVLFRDRTPIDAALLAQLPRLRHIICTGARNRTLDAQAAQSAGIRVSHTGWGPSKASTCEMTWALILAAVRRLPALMLGPQRSAWRQAAAPALLPPVLEGKRLGLIGLGQIGQRVAAMGKALGMEVVAWSPNMTPGRAAEHGVQAVSLESLLRTSQVVSLHLVPSESTHHLLDRNRLALMSPASILVNTSRAELIDTQALVDALRGGRLGYCALDVFGEEPLAVDHPLLALPNVLLTPHYGFICEEVIDNFAIGVSALLDSHLDMASRAVACAAS